MVSEADPKPRLDVRVTVNDARVDLAVEDLEHLADDLRVVAAARLFERGLVSMGMAAELCGASVAEFIDKLAELHIPVINYPIDQLKHDLADW
jgi:predicted HTH domain antitoxin